MNPTIILGILLAISVAGNALLGKLYVVAREDLGRQEQATAEARAAGLACSAGVEKLATDAKARQKKAATAIAAARKSEAAAHTRALTILATAPTDADPCKAASALNASEITSRGLK